jgi:hypothetical protein
MTGGNMWVSYVLASSATGSPNYDETNDALLNQGPAVLTLDLSQGDVFDPVALLAGVDRANQMLLDAAVIDNLVYDSQSVTFHSLCGTTQGISSSLDTRKDAACTSMCVSMAREA